MPVRSARNQGGRVTCVDTTRHHQTQTRSPGTGHKQPTPQHHWEPPATTYFQVPVHHPNLGHKVHRAEGAVEGGPRVILRKRRPLHNLIEQRAAAHKVHHKHRLVDIVVAAVQGRHARVLRHEPHRLQLILQQRLCARRRAAGTIKSRRRGQKAVATMHKTKNKRRKHRERNAHTQKNHAC